ncbi:uncharacterized protein M6B38_396840 [Iris pallida]|uniref:Uncharacterized protein n=1 Tax=Iris pallida TaxID=29817 RepID=A0AAX6FW36_IRIPA|nr:uncharacterized protein M6B38_396840 [Iris pallida]
MSRLLNSMEANIDLLHNLKEDYESLKSQILMNSTLPSLSSITATIQRQETRRASMCLEEKIEASALVVDRGKHIHGKVIFRCDHCHKTGHTKDHCWNLHRHLKGKYDKKGKKKRTRSCLDERAINSFKPLQPVSSSVYPLSSIRVSCSLFKLHRRIERQGR